MTALSRLTRRTLPLLAAILAFSLSTGIAIAQDQVPSSTWSQQDTLRIAKEVQKKLGGLAYYSVFDWITFGIHGKSIVLKGYAALPTLKTSAGNAVKNISGVESVDNEIEVLPVSMMDDRIRRAVYDRIYTQPALRKYNAYQGTVARATRPQPSVARMAGGILYDPPIGFNAIHIIVKNGNVALYGVVDNASDAAIAGMQANLTPGVFSVDNDLIVPGSPSKQKQK
jgi:hyperosmotically inducible protein